MYMEDESGLSDVLPRDLASLFSDTYTEESRYTFCGQRLSITQHYGSNLGVAAPVWEAIAAETVWSLDDCTALVWEEHGQALNLCTYFEEQKLNFKGKKIIELGAGTGIVGILLSLLGGNVTLTDLPHTLSQIEKNVSANVPNGCSLNVCALSWGLDQTKFPQDYDFIIGADIVYLKETFDNLLQTLQYLCCPSTTIFLSSKMRAEHGTVDFFQDVLPKYFNVELVWRNAEDNINIYIVTRYQN